jgi:hypothetical protein
MCDAAARDGVQLMRLLTIGRLRQREVRRKRALTEVTKGAMNPNAVRRALLHILRAG